MKVCRRRQLYTENFVCGLNIWLSWRTWLKWLYRTALCHKQDRVLVYEEWQLSPLNTPASLLRDQQNAGTEMSSKITTQGYKNVMSGQGYHTPHGAVIDIEQWLTGDQQEEMKKLRRENLLQCHFFNHESYMKLLRTEQLGNINLLSIEQSPLFFHIIESLKFQQKQIHCYMWGHNL